MQIECKLKRQGGTKVEVNGKELHFKPNAEGDHVCDIEDTAVAHRLVVQIPEAYQCYGAKAAENLAALKGVKVAAPAKQTVAGDTKPPSAPVIITNEDGDEINLSDMDLPELVALAKEEFGLTVHHKWSAETLRTKIVEATRKE